MRLAADQFMAYANNSSRELANDLGGDLADRHPR
jgi:hypothetical protein